MEADRPKTIFVVEHMEPYLFEWCFYEYRAMVEYLREFNTGLWITNASVIIEYKGEHKEQNSKYLSALKEYFSVDSQRFRLIEESVKELVGNFKGRCCMLDMRGPQQLNPEQQWDFVVFGGVLGDHPPRDRPAPIRELFTAVRHLGSLQLATDTAVLVSRLVLCNGMSLGGIPMIEEPTVRGLNKEGLKSTVQMEGFSYVSKELDLQTGKLKEGLSKKEKKEVYMSEGVHDLLLREDLDPDFLM